MQATCWKSGGKCGRIGGRLIRPRRDLALAVRRPRRPPWRAARHSPAPNTLAQNRDGGIDLRLAERRGRRRRHRAEPSISVCVAGVEILLQFGIGALRHLADGKFAGIVAAGADEFDQRLGLARPRPASSLTPDAISLAGRGRSRRRTRPGHGFDLAFQQIRRFRVRRPASWRPQANSPTDRARCAMPRAASWIALSSAPTATPRPLRRSACSSPTMRSISASTIATATA